MYLSTAILQNGATCVGFGCEPFSSDFAIATGLIDPVITIDPNFAFADQFTILLSAGVGNEAAAAAVPEPSAASIVLVAVGGLWLLRRRVRRRMPSSENPLYGLTA
jgi:hypothetical protein